MMGEEGEKGRVAVDSRQGVQEVLKEGAVVRLKLKSNNLKDDGNASAFSFLFSLK